MKLVKVVRSTSKGKKWDAHFEGDGRKFKTSFGDVNYQDYTQTNGDKKAKEMREQYRARHKKDLKTGDATRAGYLSLKILWGDSTSRAENIKQYKKQYNF